MSTVVIASFLGGILPAVLWLEFWLRQSSHREPRHLILLAFLLGMTGVIIAGPLEGLVNIGSSIGVGLIEYTFASFIIWAIIEESVKFAGAFVSGIRTRFCDEAIDPAIYLITSALGFAAAENILFLHDALAQGDVQKSIITITFRFVGATVLHVIASGAVGIGMGFAFYKSKTLRKLGIISGLCFAILLHAAFNSFIMNSDDKVLWVFAGVWILLVIVILTLEKIKSTKRIIHNQSL